MKIIGINGSHRSGKGTAFLIEQALAEAADKGAATELIELSEHNIFYCVGCNVCMAKPVCSLRDDMDIIIDKMKEADGIILGSPVYCSNVTGRMKTFIDRTRPLHMISNVLKGKVAGSVVTAGLPDCGINETLACFDRVFATLEMTVVHPRVEGPVLASGVKATSFVEYDPSSESITWRSIKKDPVGVMFARQLGSDMVKLIDLMTR